MTSTEKETYKQWAMDSLFELWRRLFEDEPPDDKSLGMWLSGHPLQFLVYGLFRAHRKYVELGGAMSQEYISRYTLRVATQRRKLLNLTKAEQQNHYEKFNQHPSPISEVHTGNDEGSLRQGE